MAYYNQEVDIGTTEVVQLYCCRKTVLCLKILIQQPPKVWFGAEGLQDKDTHPDYTLLRRIGFILHSVEYDQGHKFMASISVNNERAKSLVALESLPK